MVIFLSSFTYSMVMLFGRPSTRSSFDHDTQDDVIDIDRVRARLSSLKENLLGSDPSDSVESNIIPKVDFLHDYNPHKGEMPYVCPLSLFHHLFLQRNLHPPTK